MVHQKSVPIVDPEAISSGSESARPSSTSVRRLVVAGLGVLTMLGCTALAFLGGGPNGPKGGLGGLWTQLNAPPEGIVSVPSATANLVQKALKDIDTAERWAALKLAIPTCIDPKLVERLQEALDGTHVKPAVAFREINVPIAVMSNMFKDTACWPSWLGYFKQVNRTAGDFQECNSMHASFHNPNMKHGVWGVEDHVLQVARGHQFVHYSWMYQCGPWGGIAGPDICAGRHDHMFLDSGRNTTFFFTWEKPSGIIMERLCEAKVLEKCPLKNATCVGLKESPLNATLAIMREHALRNAAMWAVDGAGWCLYRVYEKYGALNCSLVQKMAANHPDSMCIKLQNYDPKIDYAALAECPDRGCPFTDDKELESAQGPKQKFKMLAKSVPGYIP